MYDIRSSGHNPVFGLFMPLSFSSFNSIISGPQNNFALQKCLSTTLISLV